MPEIKLEHIAMYVSDLEGARAFFEKYFNASANEKYYNKITGFQSYFLSFEGGTRLEIMTKPNVRNDENPLPHTGYTHIAFSLGSKEKVDALTKRLQSDGYKIVSTPRITGDGYYESCVLGFENNLIEITE